jgi:hypothetical protein
MAKIKYYMDEHVPLAVTLGLQRRGVDVLTVQDAELISADDIVQLQYAFDNQRVVVSQDTDFLVLHSQGHSHAGIVYAPQQTPVGELVRMLLLIYEVINSEEIAGKLEFI